MQFEVDIVDNTVRPVALPLTHTQSHKMHTKDQPTIKRGQELVFFDPPYQTLMSGDMQHTHKPVGKLFFEPNILCAQPLFLHHLYQRIFTQADDTGECRHFGLSGLGQSQ